ncbi:MKI67 FHA domain-interacting nucleolar phosphoprotein-like [Ctenocephalides felis]|uniref:MKI67 FHA domain-interacting nucleolar phosphoprotein-like n=1 Tax=Ctenocephalides felis TaxID=7515 RepID=UPI000E6E1825|nr:MKI67 FHA domain-interacting nucleolar phosphoprotein-like [Ctenocephalides felis]
MKINAKKPVPSMEKKQSSSKPRLSKAMRKKSKVLTPKNQKNTDDNGKNFIPIHKKSGVVYFGRIPHGFYEQEMLKYFSQFGKVKKTRVSRSKKTGRSKGYGYVEFADFDVAKIVAATMNNYLMGNRLIKATLVPSDKNYFAGRNWTQKKYPGVISRKDEVKNKNRRLKGDKDDTRRQKKIEKLNKIKERLLEQGIDFELPSANNSPSKVVEVVSENSSNSEGLKTESSNEEMSDENSSNDECDESDLESYASSDEELVDDEDDDDDDDMSSEEESDATDEDDDEGESDQENAHNFVAIKNKKNQMNKLPRQDMNKLLKRRETGGITKKRVNNKQKLIPNTAFTKAAKDMVKAKGAVLKNKAQLTKKHK